jgi:hypothetical protein
MLVVGGFTVLVVLVVVVMLVMGGRRSRSRLDYEAATQAAIDLRGIQQQLEVDRMRAEIRRDAKTLREEVEDELR